MDFVFYRNHLLINPKKERKQKNRNAPIPESFNDVLYQIKELNNGEIEAGLHENRKLVFPSITGTYIDGKNFTQFYQRTLARAKIPYRRPHNLRHTYATKLLESGANILTVAHLLGHTMQKMTETYAHVLRRLKKKEIEVLNDIFS